MRVAIFGGTFDPIHEAHLAVAATAAPQWRLDRVIFMPADHPPHKAGVTRAPYSDRVRMVELATQYDPRFEVSRLEEGTERSYSVNTISQVREGLSPQDELFFIIGADAFADIRTWHRWKDAASMAMFLVVSRPGKQYDVPPNVRMERLDTLDLPVSSSEIRRALSAGERPAYVPERVLNYIYEHHLYGT